MPEAPECYIFHLLPDSCQRKTSRPVHRFQGLLSDSLHDNLRRHIPETPAEENPENIHALCQSPGYFR